MSWTVVGDEPALAQELVMALRTAGVPLEATLRDEGPRLGVIVIECVGTGVPASERDGPLDDARRAVTLRGGEIVLVSDRDDSDAGLRALRRSGLPYTLVRSGPAIEGSQARPWVLPAELARPVRVRRRLVRDLAELVARDATGTGATLELGLTRSGLEVRDALASRAWVLGPALLHLCTLLGLPAFDADERGCLARCRPPMWMLARAWWRRLSPLFVLGLALAAPVHAQPSGSATQVAGGRSHLPSEREERVELERKREDAERALPPKPSRPVEN